MALTFTNKFTRPHNMGTMEGILLHEDVTEYAAGGWAPTAKPSTVLGISTFWQENANYVLRWDATNSKVLCYVMSTGAEAGAVDIGEFKFLLVTEYAN